MTNQTGVSRADTQLAAYRQLYTATPALQAEFELSAENAFEYCIARKHFVLIVPYDMSGRVLAERTFTEIDIKWSLLGGSLEAAFGLISMRTSLKPPIDTPISPYQVSS